MFSPFARLSRRTVVCLARLAATGAVAMAICLAPASARAGDEDDAVKKSAAAKKPAVVAPARHGPYELDWQRTEPTTGIPLQLLFAIMDSVEGQKELNLTDDQKLKAKYARLSTLLGRGADPQEYQTEAHQKKKDEAAKALVAMLTPAQIARLKQIVLQIRGRAALTTPEVASALTITQEQAKKLRELESTFRDRRAKAAEQLRAIEADRSLSAKERHEKASPLQKELREAREQWERAALAVLTPQQREKFEKMKGAKFGFTFHSVPQNIDRTLELLQRLPAVQAELRLTDAQRASLDDLRKRFRLPKDATPLERERAMDEKTKVVQIILSPPQAARLKQLGLQWQLCMMAPARVLVRPEMASSLQITESQQEELEELAARSQKNRALQKAKGGTPEELNRRRQQLSQVETEQALGILNPEQREKFRAMKGAEFDWSAGF
jgi:hypothetical protein